MPLVVTTLSIKVDNFSVLAGNSSKHPSQNLRLLESIFIHKFSRNLNNQSSSFPLQILSFGITFFYGYIFSNSFNIINFHWSILFTTSVYLNSKNLLFVHKKILIEDVNRKLSFKINIIKLCKIFFCAALVILMIIKFRFHKGKTIHHVIKIISLHLLTYAKTIN